jgi:hypothetical protein
MLRVPRARLTLLLCSLAACQPAEREAPPPLQLLQISPRSTQGVFLNEELVFEFNQELDRSSVTAESITIRSKDVRARGEFTTQGHRLIFRPAIPCEADLRDGGYLPGREYTVELSAFPRPDALRSLQGTQLAKPLAWKFTTVELDSPRRKGIFYDPRAERIPKPSLFPASHGGLPYPLAPEDYLYVACDKPIDPTSLHGRDFYLSVGMPGSAVGRRSQREVLVHARLIENNPTSERRPKPAGVRSSASAEEWQAAARAALIELVPVDLLRPGERGILRFQPSGGLDAYAMRDFSAGRLLAVDHYFPRSLQVASSGAQLSVGSWNEEFLSHNLRTSIVEPTSDGTAVWDDTGRVEVRYPLAAGSGADGDVELAENEERRDVQATSLRLPEGRRCVLGAEPGLVVLRAQGKLHLQGDLVRAAPPGKALECPEGQSLSAWLTNARSTPQNSATVLIAGGDLVIDGSLESSVPLLLVAGGQIRVRNAAGWKLPKPRTKDESVLWMLGGAGAPLLSHNEVRSAPLLLDPPLESNPLRRPLRYSVISGPLPPTGKVGYWRSVATTGWQPRGTNATVRSAGEPSNWRVLFIPDSDPARLDFEKAAPNPLFIEPQSSVRMWVELVVGTMPDWQPPFVDSVQLTWEQAEEAR